VTAPGQTSIWALPWLHDVDWSFNRADKAHQLHGLHPYPARFVPALPRLLIERLSDPGDLVVDPFCGSGTTLVEALLLGRKAKGSDINPVALAVARAKTRRLSGGQVERLHSLAQLVSTRAGKLLASGALVLPDTWEPVSGRRFRGLRFWFDEYVARELTALKSIIDAEEDEGVRNVALMCFSSILVAVSHQDSDTRYVRRRKNTKEGDATKLFVRRLETASDALAAFSSSAASCGEVYDCDARSIDYLQPKTVQLVVTSPPYPNAWSYHLYHQNRILWLDGDPWLFKASEIGSHRAYSAKNGSDAADFEGDMARMFRCITPALTTNGRVVVVVGDSIVRGKAVRNDETVTSAAARAGLETIAGIDRSIDPRRKAFNPAIGKIRTEHVLVFRGA
jgi:DNA modification methylase